MSYVYIRDNMNIALSLYEALYTHQISFKMSKSKNEKLNSLMESYIIRIFTEENIYGFLSILKDLLDLRRLG